jgi:DNA replication protein DnaC
MSTPAQAAVQDDVERLSRPLRLPYLRRHPPEVLATARAQRWDPAEVIKALLSEEEAGRDRATIAHHRARAGFPTGKTLETWREADSSIPVPTQQALRTLEWVSRHENLCLCGPSGTGKSHFLEGLGQLAVEHGLRVTWFSIEDLGRLVHGHRADGTVAKTITRVAQADLIIVDEIGLLPISEAAAEGFYRLVDAAYEKRSLAVASNLHPAGFDQLMPKTLATATVDRLLHHAHAIVTEGDSYRLAEATAGKGVVALTS